MILVEINLLKGGRKMFKKILTVALSMSVLLSCVPVNALESNIIKNMDFEDFAEGKALKGTSNWDVKLFDGDECVIVTDPVNGSKAVKFSKGSTTDSAYMEYSLPSEITSGIVKVSYDVRIESATKYLQNFGAVRNSKWSAYIGPRIKGAYLYANADQDLLGSAKDMLGKDWCHYEQVIDILGGTVDFKIYKDGEKIVSYQKSGLSKGDIKYFIFNLCEDHSWKANGWEATYPDGSKTPNATDPKGEIWVDNIVFEKIAISPLSSYPENGSEDVSVESDIKVEFSTQPRADISENIEIEKNGEKLTDGVSTTTEGNSSIIKIEGGLDFESEYEITVKAGTPAENSAYGVTTSDYTFSFITESIMPEITGIKDGGRYNKEAKAEFAAKDGVEIFAELKDTEGEFLPYTSGSVIDKEGDYVLKITATKNGKSQVKKFNFKVVGLVAPRAENVKIEADGLKLTGSYEYIDDNGDEEDASLTRWLIKDSDEFKEVATGNEYIIKEDDDGKVIKFAVTPKSKVDPYEGEEYCSEEVLLPSRPVLDGDIALSGEISVGGKLNAQYKYFDKNGDCEDGTVFAWYRTDEKGENKEKIENAEEKTYELTEEDINCYIICGVTPKNKAVFGDGVEVFSKPVMSMFAPKAENVEIKGNAVPGKSVSVSYKFSDKNMDKEGNTKTEWYLNGELVCREAGYSIPKGKTGSLKVIVTPVSEKFPYEGGTVEVTVSVKRNSSGGNSGGGGYSASSGGGVVNIQPAVAETIDKEVNQPSKIMLSDIAGHWAEGDIKSLFEKGIVVGDENNKFNPDNKITRAEMAALIVRAFGLKEEYKNLFTDVSGEEWYGDIVCAVSSAGIMKGDKITFRPNDYIKREELAVVLLNVLNYKGIEISEGNMNFSDNDEVSDWAKDAVGTVTAMGLMNGVGENKMSPKAYATRAQAASIIGRIVK